MSDVVNIQKDFKGYTGVTLTQTTGIVRKRKS